MSTSVVMDPAGFDFPAYLARIGLDAPPPPTIEGLARLLRAHRLAIPFENLDIALGRGVHLTPGAIFDKLVRRGRGGYCFEQNALLHRAVGALGLEGRPLLGRVWFRTDGKEVPPLNHQLELVTIDGEHWIVDAGFGGSLSPPMRLAEGETEPGEDGARFRLRRDGRFGWMLDRLGPPTSMDMPVDGPDDWQSQYSFTTDEVHPVDLELGNHWTSTRPETLFTSVIMVSRILRDGFVVLIGNSFKVRTMTENLERVLETPDAFSEALATYFGLRLERTEVERLFSF